MLKKLISSVLVISQVGVATAFAATPTGLSSQTPEMKLLEGAIALRGQKVPEQEMESQLTSMISNYESSTSMAGQQQRLENALVALGAYSPEQARALTVDVAASSQAAVENISDKSAFQNSMSNEIAHLVSMYPSGAQFSACTLGETIFTIGAAGLVTGGIMWALATARNPSGNTKPGAEILTTSAIVMTIAVAVLVPQGC